MSYPGASVAFKDQVELLKGNYGADKFPKQKIELIWEELKEFSPKQIQSICKFVMANNNFAPTLQPFRDFAAMLRERIREHEREQERQDAKDFWAGTFHSSEVKSIVETIRLRIEGKVSDDDWRQFQQILKSAADKNPAKCKRCDDTLIYFDHRSRPTKCGYPHILA
jgi:hypothetical protein